MANLETYSEKTNAEVWQSLSSDWGPVAHEALVAMVDKFNLPRQGCGFQAFETISHDGYDALAIVYDAVAGLDLGDPRFDNDPRRSYRNMFPDDRKNDQDFVITAKGYSHYDCRDGMTSDVYRQMIKRALRAGKVLPDSQYQSPRDLGKIWTWTVLTGENRLRDCAPLACSLNNQLYASGTSLSNGNRRLRFRPGVMLY